MAARKKSANSPEFPFKGTDAEKRRAAQAMARQGLRGRDFKGDSIKPMKVAYAALEVALKTERNYKTKQSYLDAFIKQRVAADLGDPVFNDSAGGESDAIAAAGLPPRGMLFVDGYPDVLWATPLAKLQADSESIEWMEIPIEKVQKAKGARLPRCEWENWATEFLLFASELRRLGRIDKAREGGRGRAKKRP